MDLKEGGVNKMEVKVEAGLKAIGSFVCRSGKCPDCGTLFDDSIKEPQDDLRYCPKCKQHKLGKVKSEGEIKG